jgi:peroxiredoxin
MVGAPATNFTLKDVEGHPVSLADNFGKNVVLLDFWTTWCVPCEAEMPHLQRLYQRYRDRGFVLLAISMDGPETVASVAPFARRLGLTFPVLLDEETQVTNVYNPARIAPLTVLINREGRIHRVRPGYQPGDEVELEQEVATLVTAGGTRAPASQPR